MTSRWSSPPPPPDKLVSKIRKRGSERFNSRIVVGYCWGRKTNERKSEYDIDFDDSDLRLKWNTSTNTRGNDYVYCEEIGYIPPARNWSTSMARSS